VMDGYVEGDLYRNREERVWHWNTASTYRTVNWGELCRLLPWSRSIPEKQTLR